MPPLPDPPQENDSDAPIAGVVPVELMTGDDAQDTALLRRMSQDAEAYLRSFPWCKTVSGSFFGGGVGGIIAIFLFNIRPARPAMGSWIWIIVGDIPSAYLPLEDAASPAEVFESYLGGMSKWVALAREGRSGTADEGIPPVNLPATLESAEKLEQRLHSLRLIVQPSFDDEGESNQVN